MEPTSPNSWAEVQGVWTRITRAELGAHGRGAPGRSSGRGTLVARVVRHLPPWVRESSDCGHAASKSNRHASVTPRSGQRGPPPSLAGWEGASG